MTTENKVPDLFMGDVVVYVYRSGKRTYLKKGIFLGWIAPGVNAYQSFVKLQNLDINNRTIRKWEGIEESPSLRALIKDFKIKNGTTVEIYRTPEEKDISLFTKINLNSVVQICSHAITKSGLLVDLEISYADSRSDAEYDPIRNVITVFPDNFLNTLRDKAFKSNLLVEESTQVIIYHEIGHVLTLPMFPLDEYHQLIDDINCTSESIKGVSLLDILFSKIMITDADKRESHKFLLSRVQETIVKIERYNKLLLQMEIKAWEEGRKLIPQSLRKHFDKDFEMLLNSYRKQGEILLNRYQGVCDSLSM
ncbi:hypothetical protein [Brevibacillus reuszeri]|uniref:hypothetical protein n=1 Tax=Brevibacillus reuszeri TaxID=54915 RepID=UPI000CCC1958|nr:hypothetical protein [Brevibacillus reuszeri]